MTEQNGPLRIKAEGAFVCVEFFAKKKRFRRTAILYVAMHPTLHKSSTRYRES